MMVNIFIGRHVKIRNDCAILKDDSNRKKKFYFKKFSNIAPLVKGEVFEKTGNHKCLPKIKFNSNKKKKKYKKWCHVSRNHIITCFTTTKTRKSHLHLNVKPS